ncbi:MAG: zinc-ribbon domain-containing protein [Methanomassiliicoccales archaeon]|nr:zinc-ribbon domain-containing protein [Methanomassiliicoccales archaeon]
MRYCSKCGEPMVDDAVFCESCGKKRGPSSGRQGFMVHQGEIVQSTRLFTKQQVLMTTISLIGFGILAFVMSRAVPSDPFFDGTRGVFAAMGLVSIGIGIAVYVLGNRNIDQES